MKAQEILNNANVSESRMLAMMKANSHCQILIELGNLFPTTKAQAIRVVRCSNVACGDVLGKADVVMIESLLNKNGFEGNYKLTKSGRWARLINTNDVKLALRKEFKF